MHLWNDRKNLTIWFRSLNMYQDWSCYYTGAEKRAFTSVQDFMDSTKEVEEFSRNSKEDLLAIQDVARK